MKMQVSSRVLLIAAIILLAANLVVMSAMHGATPAHAQGNPCVGIAAVGDSSGKNVTVYLAFSDGSVRRW